MMPPATETELVNIASALSEMAARQPDALAIAAPPWKGASPDQYVRWTYRELNDASNRIASGLPKIGIERGTRTALMVTPGLELFALTFGLFKLGAVPIMIDPGIGIRNLGVCLGEAEPEAFIGIPRAHLARIILGWGRKTIRSLVTVGPRLFWGGMTLKSVMSAGATSENMAATRGNEIAAILFTSGSTGVPKGVVYRHGNFAAQVDAIREVYDIRPGEVDLPTFPLFGLFDPALGMTTIIPDMDPTRPAKVDPRRILPAMREFGVTNMFGSPALLDTVGRYGEKHGVQIPGLKRVISAGAPVAISVMERFLGLLDEDARVVTPYGATESLPVCSIGSEEIFADTEIQDRTTKGQGVCVGRPLHGVDLKIAEITDEVETEIRELPEGETGEVVVQSPMTTDLYHNREQSTALAKISMPQGGVAHRMGDLGFLDEHGRLWFCGRKSQRVVTSGGTLFTDPCELVFNSHPSVRRSALVGVQSGQQIVPVICVELEQGKQVEDSELRELALSRPHTKQIESFLVHPGFPVDTRHNAKIKRELLAVWAAEKLR
jgi:acyl-CoA synthetase (AMP-forming)/AMP-acid ligase II